jgi:UDP-N-acetylglucosamine acyltransferase
MGGGAAVHQFTRIGHHAFIGGLAAVNHDVIPYGMLNGNPGDP